MNQLFAVGIVHHVETIFAMMILFNRKLLAKFVTCTLLLLYSFWGTSCESNVYLEKTKIN
jgi:hypothetical protein